MKKIFRIFYQIFNYKKGVKIIFVDELNHLYKENNLSYFPNKEDILIKKIKDYNNILCLSASLPVKLKYSSMSLSRTGSSFFS